MCFLFEEVTSKELWWIKDFQWPFLKIVSTLYIQIIWMQGCYTIYFYFYFTGGHILFYCIPATPERIWYGQNLVQTA